VAAPQFDRYAGSAPEAPPSPGPAAAPAPRAQPRPDVSLRGAFHRLARRGPWSSAIVCGLLAMAGVALIGLGLGLLVRAAHGSQGCAAGALTGSLQGGCLQPGSTNGVLTDWNAMLWSIQGVGVAFSGGDGGGLVVRVPLALGMALTALVLAVAGAASVRLVPPGKLRDLVLRAGAIALAYTAGMLLLGIAVSARGDHVAVGPDDGLLFLWGLILGFTGSLAGMFQHLFGAALPRAPRAMAAARLGSWAGIVEAAVVGTVTAVVLGMLLGAVASATHPGDTSNALHAAFFDVTTRPLPSSPVGTIASVVYLILGLPTLATWVIAYSLVIPTVTLGTALGSTDYGLLAGDHDAWLWAAVALPVVVTLLAGYVAARRRRSSSPEAAMLDGAIGGLAFAALTFLTLALLDGGATLSPSGPGGIAGGVSGTGFLLGPGLQYALGALLLWGVVGGAAGGYLSLLFLVRGIRPPFLRRYDIAPPPAPAPAVCPSCGVAVATQARFCSSCGAGIDPAPPG
ncbi:MAG TPA: zinc ribbon domain-containing protein, partial [Candidatus Dormibacteraeota bacterium]